jgi:hypothetical protein
MSNTSGSVHEATGRHDGHEDHLSLFGVQAQRLDVDAGGHRVLEQRDLIDVDGQQVARAGCRWHVALLDIAAR